MAGLPWFKVSVDLIRHDKSVALAGRLHDERAWAYVVQMWAWFCERAGSGERFGPDAAYLIANGAGWKGDADEFCRHMVAVGFLEVVPEGFRVHDWEEWGGAHITRNAKDKARKKRSRAKEKDKIHADVTVTSRGQDAEIERVAAGEVESREINNDKAPEESRWPLVSAVLVACQARGFSAEWPSGEKTTDRLEDAVRSVGITEAVARTMAVVEADRALRVAPRTHLGWYLDAIRGKAAPKLPRSSSDRWQDRLTRDEFHQAHAELRALHPDLAAAPLGCTGDPALHPVQEIAALNEKWRAVAEARP